MGTVLKLLIAGAFGYAIFRVGLTMLRMFAQPVAEPPPPGELRRAADPPFGGPALFQCVAPAQSAGTSPPPSSLTRAPKRRSS